jgi:hypothetical protein
MHLERQMAGNFLSNQTIDSYRFFIVGGRPPYKIILRTNGLHKDLPVTPTAIGDGDVKDLGSFRDPLFSLMPGFPATATISIVDGAGGGELLNFVSEAPVGNFSWIRSKWLRLGDSGTAELPYALNDKEEVSCIPLDSDLAKSVLHACDNTEARLREAIKSYKMLKGSGETTREVIIYPGYWYTIGIPQGTTASYWRWGGNCEVLVDGRQYKLNEQIPTPSGGRWLIRAVGPQPTSFTIRCWSRPRSAQEAAAPLPLLPIIPDEVKD